MPPNRRYGLITLQKLWKTQLTFCWTQGEWNKSNWEITKQKRKLLAPIRSPWSCARSSDLLRTNLGSNKPPALVIYGIYLKSKAWNKKFLELLATLAKAKQNHGHHSSFFLSFSKQLHYCANFFLPSNFPFAWSQFENAVALLLAKVYHFHIFSQVGTTHLYTLSSES